MHTIDNIIGGAARRSASTRTAPVFNPATGEQSAVLPLSTKAELDAAVAAAKAALPAWADMPPLKRARYMFRFKELLDANTGKIAEAISGYKSFVHDYPNDPEIPYARYKIAQGEYDSVSASVFLPPLEERDLAAVNDALVTIRAFLSDYPNSEHSEQLRFMLEVVLGLLARHELYVARYYLREDRFEAAAARVNHAVEAFPRSGLEPEGLLLLAEIRMKQKRSADARDLLERLLKRHPESPFSVPARKYLAFLGGNEPVGVLRQGDQKKPAVEPGLRAQ